MLSGFLLLLGGTLASACAVAPLAYAVLQALAGGTSVPFSRVFDRAALLGALVFLWFLRRRLGLRELGPHYAGLASRSSAAILASGAALSLAVSLAALPFVVARTEVHWDPHPLGDFAREALATLPAALLVAFFEEGLFRLVLFERFSASRGPLLAALGSSALYAFVHFVAPVRDFVPGGWSPLEGAAYLAAVGERLALPGVLPGAVGLFLVGLVLCLALRRSGSFAACVGLHAGWVLAAKLSSYAVRRPSGWYFPPGTGRRYFLVSTPEAWIAIACVGACVLALAPRWRGARGESGSGVPRPGRFADPESGREPQ